MSSTSLIPATYYSVAPARARLSGHGHEPIGVMARLAQGAGSALLMFAGADSMTSVAAASASGAPPLVDFSSVDGLTQSLLTGGLTGPAQIIAAVVLFIAAGKCIARFIGLGVVAAALVLYRQGVTVADAWLFIEQLAQRFAAASAAFQTAPVG